MESLYGRGKILWNSTPEHQSHKLLKITHGHLSGEKREGGNVNGDKKSGLRRSDLGTHRSRQRTWHDFSSEGKGEKKNKKKMWRVIEKYNYYNIFLFWTLEQMTGSIFLYCHKLMWNTLARYNLHCRARYRNHVCLHTKEVQTAVCSRCFCVTPVLMQSSTVPGYITYRITL